MHLGKRGNTLRREDLSYLVGDDMIGKTAKGGRGQGGHERRYYGADYFKVRSRRQTPDVIHERDLVQCVTKPFKKEKQEKTSERRIHKGH